MLMYIYIISPLFAEDRAVVHLIATLELKEANRKCNREDRAHDEDGGRNNNRDWLWLFANNIKQRKER